MNSFVGLAGSNQVAFPDHLMNCRSEVAVELNALFDIERIPGLPRGRLS